MSILDGITSGLEDMFSLGENQDRSLDVVEGGNVKKYGKLGSFANKFDQSAERNYVEEGYLRKDLFNVDPKQREIIMQEPNITVLIKKRMFSSLAENFDTKYMDADEKIFYKASKILFENKCKQLSAYEKLCRIERANASAGEFDSALLPLIISLADELENADFLPLFNGEVKVNNDLKKFSKVIDQIKKVYTFSPNRQYTEWLKDNNKLFTPQLGEGTGVIEFTNVTNLSTNTSVVSGNSGGCSLNFTDPFELMVITEVDIEKALSDATNVANNHLIFRMGKESADNIIARNTKLLNDKRRARGAGDITFKINPDTLLSKRVIAIVDALGEEVHFTYDAALGLGGLGVGNGVQIDPSCLRGGALLGENGLATKVNKRVNVEFLRIDFTDKNNFNSEENLFKDIVVNLFNKLQLDANARSLNRELAKTNNYARRKMRFNFLGKLIIQAMDQIHIYIGSKTSNDTKVLSGLQSAFTGLGAMQNSNIMLNDIKNLAYSQFMPSGNFDFEMEKNVILGPQFPSYLWGILRNQFVNERGGTHVFAGLVDSAVSNYNDGAFTVSVQGRDNLEYLTQGFVNFKPSAEVWNGALYDPLTPFETKFDAVSSNFKNNNPELLKENKALLAAKNLLKYKSGPLAGQSVTEENLIHDAVIDSANVKRRVFHAPDGLVYKWKEGIGTFVRYGDSLQANDANKVLSQPTIAPPLAGQDVMNSISLLITGEPYNYANYYKAIREFGGGKMPSEAGKSSAHTFFDSFRSELTKRNIMWGNFIPFKNLVVGESQYSSVLQGQASITNESSNVSDLLKQQQDLLDQQSVIESAQQSDDRIPNAVDILKKRIQDIDDKIKLAQDNLDHLLTTDGKSLSVVGNDVSFNYDNFINNTPNNVNKNLFDPSSRRQLRKKINFLTRRFSWKVRANEDQNLMIVDDTYDKDYDIIAFEKELQNIELLNSEFTSVKDKVFAAAQILNMEVFCDTQGHIRVRPPAWNKVPSSVFYRMLQLKDDSGIQLFPQFLNDLFTNQLKGVMQRIEALEDLIRLDVMLLGAGSVSSNDQSTMESYINTDLKGAANGQGSFKFLSNVSGNMTSVEDLLKSEESAQDGFGDFARAAKTTNFFTAADRSRATRNLLDLVPLSANTVDYRSVDAIIKRIETKTGQQVNLDDLYINNIYGTTNTPLLTKRRPDIVKLSNDLANKIGERQKLVKIAYSLLKNYKEVTAIDKDKSFGNKIIIPGTYHNSNIPEFYENLIEDESYDDLGPNSGSRYIIKNSRILAYDISENKPEYTHVSVTGLIDPNTIGNQSLLNPGDAIGSGNAQVTAEAIDYDMWRMYGVTQSTPVKAPFFSNPRTQCAPYAATLLSKARQNILRGSITIIGNEYMQPGEVVYLEQRGLLFYVESVRHQFQYDSTFTTTLQVSFGHTPGEYIPTPFDVVGKMIYLNRDNAQIINLKQFNTYDELSIGAILIDNNQIVKDNSEGTRTKYFYSDAIFSGNYGIANDKTISNMAYYVAQKVNAHASKGSNINVKVELRVYYDDVVGGVDFDLYRAAQSLKEILINPDSAPAGAVDFKASKQSFNNFKDANGKDMINIETINISDTTGERRRPSEKAFDAARNIAKTKPFGQGAFEKYSDSILNTMYKGIIDCYIAFEDAKPANEGKK